MTPLLIAAVAGFALAASPAAADKVVKIGILAQVTGKSSADAQESIRGAQMAIGRGERVHVAWNGSGAAEPKGPRGEIRQVLNHFVTYSMGRRPRLLP